MVKHTLLIAFRKFKNSLLINSLNFVGLTAGFAIFIILGLYYLQETSYEKGFSDSENIYRVNTQFIDAKRMASSSPNLLHSFDNAPEVLATTYVESLPSGILEIGEKKGYSRNILKIDTSFFKIFDFRLKSGYPGSGRFPEQTVLLSERFALDNFGTIDLIGEELWFGENRLEVLDIVLSEKQGTHLQFEVLIVKPTPEYKDMAWLSLGSGVTYIKTVEEYAGNQLDNRLLDLSKDRVFPAMAKAMNFREDYSVEDWVASGRSIYNFVQPIADIHLDEPLSGDERLKVSRSVVNTFGLVAILILVVSCLNFIHFSTAKASLRMKEVGVKRTLGSSRSTLVFQLLLESLIWSLAAVFFAVGLVELVLKIIGASHPELFRIALLDAPNFLIVLVLTILGMGLISAIYPSFYLTRKMVVSTLRASNSLSAGASGSHALFKRSVVVLQFALASIQIIACVFMVRQATFMQKLDLGFNPENALAIDASQLTIHERGIFAQKLSELSSATGVTSFSELPGDQEEEMGVSVASSEGYMVNLKWVRLKGSLLNSLGVDLIEGSAFDHVKKPNVAIINLKAAQLLGDAGKIGEVVQGHEVIGIVDDFYYSSIRKGAEPILFTQQNYSERYFLTKSLTGLDDVREIWSDLSEVPFEYSWLDNRFENLQNRELQIVNLFTGFTAFAVLISLLGLFSLGLFIFEQREREFGIRKILGASPSQIIKLFTSGTSLLLMIGFAIACPVAIYGIRYWLRNFSEVVPINFSGVLLAAMIAFGSALLAILLQSIYAARINPVETLRNE